MYIDSVTSLVLLNAVVYIDPVTSRVLLSAIVHIDSVTSLGLLIPLYVLLQLPPLTN